MSFSGSMSRHRMRELVITQNITLDGSIEMLGDWFDPQGQAGVDMSDLMAEITHLTEQGDGLLLGRRTFEDMRGYWPLQTDDQTGITEELNEVHKYVVSSTMTDPAWQNSTVLSGNWLEQVQALKQESGKSLGVTGSITLTHALIEAKLVDEYRLFVYPVVQGRGRRLFPDGYESPLLKLVDAKTFRSGIALLRYAVGLKGQLTP
jgi:dihydrofolate reductase